MELPVLEKRSGAGRDLSGVVRTREPTLGDALKDVAPLLTLHVVSTAKTQDMRLKLQNQRSARVELWEN